MKKSILSIFSVFTFVMIGSAVNAQQLNVHAYQNLIGKARGAAHECIQPYVSQGIAIDGSVSAVGECSVKGGGLHTVSFYTTTHCHQEPCPRPASILVATVYFDCDDKVISVECAE